MKKFDRKVWIFIALAALGIPGYFQLRSLFLGELQPYYYFISGAAFSLVVSLVITYVNMALLGRYFDKVLPWQNNARKINLRLVLETVITSISAALIISSVTFILDRIFPEMAEGRLPEVYFGNITVAVIVNLIALGIIEGNSIYIMWKESLLHSEKLRRENIESQFAVLKNQVNPHFLFNSMNVLSSLVVRSPDKAREFINDFSRIYRYIFDVGDETVVEVKKELDFIHAYIALHQKRHGDNLNYSVNISGEILNLFIPVLSLQILVENAIKHNEISGLHPLCIEIYNDEHNLIIKNNYQPREEKQESMGIGLMNLKERYRYLSEKEPVFLRKDDEYIASLPLLEIE
jgi:sensor histidine kinase YesM